MKKLRIILLFGIVAAFCSGCASPTSDTPKSSVKILTGFSFTAPSATGIISESTHTINVTVPYSTALESLVPTIAYKGASLSPASLTPQNFANPVTYTVTAADSSTQAYTVIVSVATDSDKDISSFGFANPAATGTVDSTNGTISVTIPSGFPPFGINVTALVANFSATGVSVYVDTVAQISGTTKNDFSSPVTYTVRAQDGSTKNYTVTVSRNAFRTFGGTAPVTVSTFAGLAPGSADGTGTSAQFNGPSGISTDGTNLFVADSANCTIRSVSIATGTVSTLAGSAGTSGSADGTNLAARFNNPKGIATDGTNAYVADSGNNAIRSIAIATGIVTTLAGASAGFSDPTGLAIIGTSLYVADSGNHVIRAIDISGTATYGTITNFAGTAGSSGSADGPAATAQFNSPLGLATDGTNLYVADSLNNAIRKITVTTSIAATVPVTTITTITVTTIAGTAGTSGSADGTGTAARFNSPCGISIDAANANLYISDKANHTIRKLEIATSAVTTLAGTVGFPGANGTITSSADGTGTNARFGLPLGSALIGTNLYVADGGAMTIRKLDVTSATVTAFAGNRSFDSTDGTRLASRFGQPRGIATDGTNLYICDTDNFIIRKIVISTGAVSTIAGLAGTPGSADSTGTGSGTAARFNLPQGITTDGTKLYVADSYNHAIRAISIATNEVSTLAGSPGTIGNTNGTGSTALFNRPLGITNDGTWLYVADTDNNCIRRVEISTGTTTTLNCTPPLILPVGITTDGKSLYVSEWNVNTIRKINMATGATSSMPSAGFGQIAGLSTDGTYIYAADWNNNDIKRVVISTGIVTTVAGTTARINRPWGIANDGLALYITDCENCTIRKIQ